VGLDVAQLRVKVKADLTELDSAAVESRRKLRHLADAVTPVDNSLRKLGSTAEQTAWKLRSRDYERFGEWARGTGTRLTQGVTLPLLAVGAAAMKVAGDFDQSMANVNSLVKLSDERFAALKEQVLGMTTDRRITQGPRDLAAGLYDVVSSGFSGQKAMDVLRQAAYGATAGLTDTATSVRVLAAVLNSGIKGVNSAREAMDILFQEVNLGINSFEGLANALGDVLPTAATAGVSLQEVAAGLAVMTKDGISVNESVTALNQLLVHIIKPSNDAAKVMQSLGIEYGAAALQSKGLAGWLKDVAAKAGDNKQALTEMMPEIRAMKGLLSLTKGDGRAFAEMMREMAKATENAGATQGALSEQLKGFKAQTAILKKDIETSLIKAFDVMKPVVEDLIQKFDALVIYLGKMSPAARKFWVEMGLVAAALGPLLFGLGNLARGLVTLIANWGAVRGVMVAVRAFMLGPWGIALGVAALAVTAYANNWLGLKDVVDEVADFIGERIQRIADWSLKLAPIFGMQAPGSGGKTWKVGDAVPAGLKAIGEEGMAALKASATPGGGRRGGGARRQALVGAGGRRGGGGGAGGSGANPIDAVTISGTMGPTKEDWAAWLSEHKGRMDAAVAEAVEATAQTLQFFEDVSAELMGQRKRKPLARGGGSASAGLESAAQLRRDRFEGAMGAESSMAALVEGIRASQAVAAHERLAALAGAIDPTANLSGALERGFGAMADERLEQQRMALSAAEASAKVTRRLEEALADAREEWAQAAGAGDAYQQVLNRLNIASRELTSGQQELGKEIARLAEATRIAATAGDAIGEAFGSALLDTTDDFLTNLRRNVERALMQMAAQIAASQVGSLVTQGVGALIGAVGGGGSSGGGWGPVLAPQGLAAGGPVSPGRAYLVGELGPELFVPRQGGQIVPSGAGNTYITMHIQTPDVAGFRASQAQILQDAHREAARLARRGGG